MGEAGPWSRVAPVSIVMSTEGLMLNVMNFGAAISACKRDGQWQHVALIADVMHSAVFSRGISQDVIKFNAAISSCEKGGWWQRVVPSPKEV
eukprot:876115-Karenia_brevis.AAC.1